MDSYQELFDVLTRCRNVSSSSRQSKAASVQQQQQQDQKCANVIHQVVRKSMAASTAASGKGINQAQVIHNFLFS